LRRVLGTIVRFILLVAAASALMACHRPSYCEVVCACRRGDECSQIALSDCEKKATGDKLASEELGCSKEFDALTVCLDATAECVTDSINYFVIPSCDTQQIVYDKCMAAALGQ